MARRADLAERMAGVADRLGGLVERATDTLEREEFPTDPAGVDRLMKSVRSTSLAGRGALSLSADAERRLAAAEGEESDEDDGEEELDAAGLEALRCEVDRLYARFDQEPADEEVGDLGDASAGAAPRLQGLGHPGARPSAAAA